MEKLPIRIPSKDSKPIRQEGKFTIYLSPDGTQFKSLTVDENSFKNRALNVEEKTDAIQKPAEKLKLAERIAPEPHWAALGYGDPKRSVITADNRSKWQREQDDKKTKAWLAAEHKKDIDLKVMNYMVLPAGLLVALATPAGPYINIGLSAYSAYNLYDLYQKGTLGWNLETGANVLGLAPGIGMAGKAVKPFIVSGINSAKPYINLALTGDKYTTLGGRYGYYGNPLMRFLYTLDRSSTKPRLGPVHPELLRKTDEYVVNPNGTILISNPHPRADLNRTNFTTDRPVVSHSNGNWDHKPLLIVNPKVVQGKTPISIEPSDMFYINENIVAKPNLVTLVSGDPVALKTAWGQGMSTLSSKELRSTYKQMKDYYDLELKRINLENKDLPPLLQKLSKKDMQTILARRRDLTLAYALEIQRLQSLRGTPTLEDYKFLEWLHKLNSGVVGIETLNPTIIYDKLSKMTLDDVMNVTYPNGRKIKSNYFTTSPTSERTILNTFPYNRVFYDPTSTVESNFREALKLNVKL